jgi:predicted nucleic acid-binding protein
MRYLVDTDWLIDAFVGVPTSVDVLERLSDHGMGVSIVSYPELFEGAFGHPDSRARLAQLHTRLDRFITVPLSIPIMEVFALTRASLRRTGALIPDMDLLIAATAIHHDLTLLTRNTRHFGRIGELNLYRTS